jgi:putative RecB family exonuclease
VWAQVLAEDHPRFESPAQAAEYAALGQELLSRYLPSPHAQREPLLLEYTFALELDGHTLTGTVDRIDEADAGLVIVDYKTSKRRPNQAVLNDDLQFTIYSWGVTETLGLPVVRCEHLHLRKMETFVTYRGPADFQRLREEVLPRVLRGIEAGVFPPSPSWWCNYCDYQYLCRDYPGA